MLMMCREFGFSVRHDPDQPGISKVDLVLR